MNVSLFCSTPYISLSIIYDFAVVTDVIVVLISGKPNTFEKTFLIIQNDHYEWEVDPELRQEYPDEYFHIQSICTNILRGSYRNAVLLTLPKIPV